MKARDYWPALRTTLIGWLAALCLGAGAIAIVLHRQWEVEDAWLQAQKQWHQRQQQVAYRASYQPDIDFFMAHRAKWQASGVMQPPDFDHWDAVLVASQQQFLLPHISYQIQPSVACAAATCQQQWPASQPPEFNFTVTPIKLTWSVAHESVVVDWLQQLEQAYAGLLLVRHCRWALTEGADMIATQCELDLFNFSHVLPDALVGSP
ncbi:hypothetical protein [Methylophilus sp. 5]|uniref:hypothetical protein n=1 Tax=Methylophilus sp. 5 TaxID=1112274 RepID=UPI000492048B|nr:hypothetical protein [Methylophilus sp. 5]